MLFDEYDANPIPDKLLDISFPVTSLNEEEVMPIPPSHSSIIFPDTLLLLEYEVKLRPNWLVNSLLIISLFEENSNQRLYSLFEKVFWKIV